MLVPSWMTWKRRGLQYHNPSTKMQSRIGERSSKSSTINSEVFACDIVYLWTSYKTFCKKFFWTFFDFENLSQKFLSIVNCPRCQNRCPQSCQNIFSGKCPICVIESALEPPGYQLSNAHSIITIRHLKKIIFWFYEAWSL